MQQHATPAIKPKHETKQSIIINLLSQPDGTTLKEIITATCWKPHSVRDYLSNMRHKNNIDIDAIINSEGKRVYKIIQEADAP